MCVCVCRRRIPIPEVGSAARHVNACCLHIIRGILQLPPGSAVHKLGSGDLRGGPGVAKKLGVVFKECGELQVAV